MTQTEADKRVRPDAMDDATVEAVGAVSEALECVERARGELYSFHQLMGHADLLLARRATDCAPPATMRSPSGSTPRSSAAMWFTAAGPFKSSRISTTTTGRCSANTNGALGTNFSGESATYSNRR